MHLFLPSTSGQQKGHKPPASHKPRKSCADPSPFDNGDRDIPMGEVFKADFGRKPNCKTRWVTKSTSATSLSKVNNFRSINNTKN